MKKHQYGLTLSGGGVRGLAHVGVIKALEERGIEPTILSGASAGAIVGALYAKGYSSEDMLDFFHSTEIFRWQNYSLSKPGFIDTDKFYDIFKDHLPEDSFESLEKDLYIVTTDILNGEPQIFHEGQLIKAILASAAFPVVLSPVEIDGVLYADGGIVNNFPVELIREKCETLIGVYVNVPQKLTKKDLDSTMDVLERAYHLNISYKSIKKMDQVDIPITPDELTKYNTFDTRKMDKIYKIGYEEACRVLDEYLEKKEEK